MIFLVLERSGTSVIFGRKALSQPDLGSLDRCSRRRPSCVDRALSLWWWSRHLQRGRKSYRVSPTLGWLSSTGEEGVSVFEVLRDTFVFFFFVARADLPGMSHVTRHVTSPETCRASVAQRFSCYLFFSKHGVGASVGVVFSLAWYQLPVCVADVYTII